MRGSGASRWDRWGRSPLAWACVNLAEGCVAALLAAGVSPDGPRVKANSGGVSAKSTSLPLETPLEIVLRTIAEANADGDGNDADRARMEAARRCARLLLDAGAGTGYGGDALERATLLNLHRGGGK
mmetsp:Transcript_22071/g.71403  ORF Transcript_22071/g.71403 Transcript_22071/m.71403 type:complete len:127 (-) Transcript_22071:1544-1924(-)